MTKSKFFMFLTALFFLSAVVFSQTITVTSPHSGDTWYKGNTYNITWTSTGIPTSTNLKINIFKDSIAQANFVKQLKGLNSGTKSWPIPSSYATGTYYIRIKTDDNAVHGDSDRFSIVRMKFVEAGPIVIKSPDKKTRWRGGEYNHIKWTTFALDIRTEMNISLYNATGKRMIKYIGKGSNGIYGWNIPEDLSGYYKIKIAKAGQTVKGTGKGKMVAMAYKPAFVMSQRFHISPKPTLITLKPHIRNRHSRRRENKRKQEPGYYDLGSIPGTARVGYFDYYSHGRDRDFYLGFIFRSRLFFEVSHLKGKIISKAVIYFRRHKLVSQNHYHITNCGTKLYVLEGPWELPVRCIDTPGYLFCELPKKDPMSVDVTQLVWNWAYGTQQNHGLLFAGPKEDFSHPFQGTEKCVNYYNVYLEVEIYEKAK